MGDSRVPVWLGTSGYAWPEWIGPFYPRGITDAQLLVYYASQFPCVEINSTFLRRPTPGQFTRLARSAAAGFQFSLKVPRTASHERSVHDLRPFRRAADELAAMRALIGLVLEFPEAFHDTARNRRWVERIAESLRPYVTWVEFRHRSWHRPRLGDWLRQRGMELAAVDVPDEPTAFPSGFFDPRSTRLYVRLHSRDAAKWAHASERHDYDFQDHVLREWINKLTRAAPGLASAHLIFGNAHDGQAARNARRMGELMVAEAPALQVIRPPANVPLVQGLIF
jgi:uncharacterized protein YecE (DUF72 family)